MATAMDACPTPPPARILRLMSNLELDLQLAALRARKPRQGFTAWMRGFQPFDRRAIRVPSERDAYWTTLQRRLAESDAAFILAQRATQPPTRTWIGD